MRTDIPFSGYEKCKYGTITPYGLTCKYSCSITPASGKFPCPSDSGTDRNRNGICYAFLAFKKDKYSLPCSVGDIIYKPTYMLNEGWTLDTSKVTEVSTKRIWTDEGLYYFHTAIGDEIFIDKKEANNAIEMLKKNRP